MIETVNLVNSLNYLDAVDYCESGTKKARKIMRNLSKMTRDQNEIARPKFACLQGLYLYLGAGLPKKGRK